MALIDIAGLSVEFPFRSGGARAGTLCAVDDVSLAVEEGEVLGIVGESGSGKSAAMLAALGLVPPPAKVTAARIAFAGTDLRTLSARSRRKILGRDLAMVFQDPAASLNPSFTIGFQLRETLHAHLSLSRAESGRRAMELLEQVGIGAAAERLDAYPHLLSGGMNQRVMIAMAIACNPRLLIADEPTTALDVTIAAQILDLLRQLRRERAMALILISHDMAVMERMAERVLVMYAGQIVEEQTAARLFAAPRHPYTAALLAARPEKAARGERLRTIEGTVPGVHDRPQGCLFSPRCAYADEKCRTVPPPLEAVPGGALRCFYPL